MTTTRDDPEVVALVASEGGLEALTTVIGDLPADFPAVVIALQHQAPVHESHLAEILCRAGLLHTSVAEDGQQLEAGRIYVVPPGAHALVTAGPKLALIASGTFPPHRPSADLLLTSMAITLGPRAVAVILSGRGHDGATGATAIHRFGGFVVATDEATSERFEMPAAAIERDDVVDVVTSLSSVAKVLCEALADS